MIGCAVIFRMEDDHVLIGVNRPQTEIASDISLSGNSPIDAAVV